MSIDVFPGSSLAAPAALLGQGSGGTLPTSINSAALQNMGPTVQAYTRGNRPIRVSGKFRIVAGAATDVYRAVLLQDGVPIADHSISFNVAGWGMSFPPFDAVVYPSQGIHNYTMQIMRETGGGTYSIQSVEYLRVEDIGGGSEGGGPIVLGWGLQSSNPSGFTAETDVPGCSVTVPVPAGRVLKATGKTAAIPTAANDEIALWLSMDGVHHQVVTKRPPNTGDFTDLTIVHPFTTVAPGPHTFKLSMQRTAGTAGTFSMSGTGADRQGFLLLEDVTGEAAAAGSMYEAAWTPVTSFLNGWQNYDPALYDVAAYRKINDIVYVRGLVRLGSPLDSVAFVFPPGYRPLKNAHFGGAANNLFCVLEVRNNGDMRINAPSNAWVSLDNVCFGTT